MITLLKLIKVFFLCYSVPFGELAQVYITETAGENTTHPSIYSILHNLLFYDD